MSIDMMAADHQGIEPGDLIDFDDDVEDNTYTTNKAGTGHGENEDDLDFDDHEGTLDGILDSSGGPADADYDGEGAGHVEIDISGEIVDDFLDLEEDHGDHGLSDIGVGSQALDIGGSEPADVGPKTASVAQTTLVEDITDEIDYDHNDNGLDVRDDEQPAKDATESNDLDHAYDEVDYENDDQVGVEESGNVPAEWELDEGAGPDYHADEDNSGPEIPHDEAGAYPSASVDVGGQGGNGEISSEFQDAASEPNPFSELEGGGEDQASLSMGQEDVSAAAFEVDEEEASLSEAENGHADDDDTGMENSQGAIDDISDRPAVRVLYRDYEYALLAKSASDDPDTYFFSDVEALDYPLSQFLDSIREVVTGEISREEELVIRVDGLGLEFSETMEKKLLDQTTFGKIVDLHSQLVENDEPVDPEAYTLTVYLVTRPHYSQRLESLMQSASNGDGLSSLRFSYSGLLTKDVSPDQDEGQYMSNGSDFADEGHDATSQPGDEVGDGDDEKHNDTDEDFLDDEALLGEEAGSPAGVSAPLPGAENDDSLGGSYDQVVDDVTRDDAKYHDDLEAEHAPTAGGAEASAAVEAALETATAFEDHPSHPDQTTENPHPEAEGHAHHEDEDDAIEIWYGDSTADAGLTEQDLNFELEHGENQVSEHGQDEDDRTIIIEDQSREVEEAAASHGADADTEEPVDWENDWDNGLEAGGATQQFSEEHAESSADIHVQEGAPESETGAGHAEWDADPELDLGTAGAEHSNDGVPSSLSRPITSEQTSASGTLNGDEIDYENDDDIAAETLASAAAQQDGPSVDASHSYDPDEINWDDADDAAAAPAHDPGSSTPASAAGKRSRDADDVEDLGEGHDVKRHRA